MHAPHSPLRRSRRRSSSHPTTLADPDDNEQCDGEARFLGEHEDGRDDGVGEKAKQAHLRDLSHEDKESREEKQRAPLHLYRGSSGGVGRGEGGGEVRASRAEAQACGGEYVRAERLPSSGCPCDLLSKHPLLSTGSHMDQGTANKGLWTDYARPGTKQSIKVGKGTSDLVIQPPLSLLQKGVWYAGEGREKGMKRSTQHSNTHIHTHSRALT